MHRYDDTGHLTERITLPVSQITACAFGGPDGATLYITTSRLGRTDGPEPSAGAVFVAETGYRSAPVYGFAG